MKNQTPKHTPGPWDVDQTLVFPKFGHDWLIVREGHGESGMWIALVTIDSSLGRKIITPENQRANAQLIASAPDLLAALQKMDALVETLWKSVPWGKTFNLDIQALNEAPIAAKRAINKATNPQAEGEEVRENG